MVQSAGFLASSTATFVSINLAPRACSFTSAFIRAFETFFCFDSESMRAYCVLSELKAADYYLLNASVSYFLIISRFF
jgi:hypothetical protein